MPDPIDIAVGARLRIRRRELGISQSQLADHLQLTFQQVQKYERGANRISASMMVRAAECLKCSVAFLVGEEESSDTAPFQSIVTRLTGPGVLELVEAFASISDAKHRHAVLQLARALAPGSEDEAT